MTKIKRMNPEIKAKWVAALRSGEYKQGKGCLSGPEGFCCLGVLGDLMVKEGKAEWQGTNCAGQTALFNESTVLATQVANWAGLPSEEGPFCGEIGLRDPLTWMNDSGVTFKELAEIIEDKL